MKKLGFVALALTISTAATGTPVDPWEVHASKPGVLQTQGKTDGPSAFTLWLECSAGGGFVASLSSTDISFNSMVSGVTAKVGDKQSDLDVDQNPGLPALMQIKNIDIFEKALLAGDALKLRIQIMGKADVIETFKFADLRPSAAQVLKTCPPF
ncbi:MAG TPA: hypothetical protein VGG48_14070 [Rhizomicrobium sp.]|jgi:hypothetical protein